MKRLNFLINIFKLICLKKIKIVFSNPKKCKILLVDNFRENEVLDNLLKPNEYEVLDTRFGFISNFSNLRNYSRIFLSSKILLYFFYYYFLKKKYSFFNSYVCAYIKISNAKIILDVTKYGFLLECLDCFPNKKFIFVLDYLYLKKTDKNIMGVKYPFHNYLINFMKKNFDKNFDNLLISVFGKKDKDILLELGLSKKINIFPGGSYKAISAKKKINSDEDRKFDILFVSQIESQYLNFEYEEAKVFYDFIINANSIILKNINRYIQKNDLSCLVQLRDYQEKKNLEKEFILGIFKDYPKLFFSERSDPLNSYKSILKSDITISNHSQLSFEAMYLEKKSLIAPLNLTKMISFFPSSINSDKQGWKWIIEDDTYESFETILDDLRKEPIDKYLSDTKKARDYIISLNSDFGKNSIREKLIC